MKNDALIIDDLHHKYDKRECSNWILNEINLKIENGELLGLLGPSGCGKTTLLRLIAGFEYPSRGKISLNDEEISSRKKILCPEKRNIGMVFQDYALFPHLDVEKNISFGLSKNEINEGRLEEVLAMCNLENYKNSGKIYVTKIEKIIETFLSIFDLIILTFTNKNDNNIEHDHSLINEEINLNERF